MKFIIHKSKDGQFYFTIVAKNGKTIVTSEMYTTKSKAKQGIVIVIDWIYCANSIAKDVPIIDNTLKKMK